MLGTFVVIFFVPVNQVGLSIISSLLDLGVGVYGAMSEKIDSKAVDENGDGLDDFCLLSRCRRSVCS